MDNERDKGFSTAQNKKDFHQRFPWFGSLSSLTFDCRTQSRQIQPKGRRFPLSSENDVDQQLFLNGSFLNTI